MYDKEKIKEVLEEYSFYIHVDIEKNNVIIHVGSPPTKTFISGDVDLIKKSTDIVNDILQQFIEEIQVKLKDELNHMDIDIENNEHIDYALNKINNIYYNKYFEEIDNLATKIKIKMENL